MVTICVKINRIVIFLISIIVAISLGLLLIFFIKFNCFKQSQSPDAFLKNLGYNFKLVDEKQITIPAKFGENMKKYNELQKNQGFDLEKFSGKVCTQKKYYIKSNVEKADNYIANLIVFDGVVVGGDLQEQYYGSEAKSLDSLCK